MKRCPLCGKEYEQEEMCPSCRIVLIDTETNRAVATTPEKKSRVSQQRENVSRTPVASPISSQKTVSVGIKPIHIIAIGVILVIVIVAAMFMMKSTKAKKEAELIYQQQSSEVTEESVQEERTVEEETVEEEEPEVVEQMVPAIEMNHVEMVGASSELSESNMVHSSERVVDGDMDTAWVEGAGGQGIGEKITLGFDGTYQVSGFRIAAGYQKSDYAYYNNSRPKEIEVEFSDGSVEMYTLEDSFGSEQKVTFASPKETNNMRIIIKSVYPGTKYEDTCITEISLF